MSNGFDLDPLEPINQFALVSYIQDPLGGFLDSLRLQLEPEAKPHAHVTILPPRPLCGDAEQAIRDIKKLCRDFQPFTIRLGDVSKFEGSDVVYIDLASGCSELFAMYTRLNSGQCRFSERYCYCPHITLGQNLPQEKVQQTLEAAMAAWKNWPRERSFRVETLSFVQNTTAGRWIDLDRVDLRDLPARPPLTQTDQVGPIQRV